MNTKYLNAAVASSILDDISNRFMSFHDDLNDMNINADNYDVDYLMVRYFGHSLEEHQQPLVRAILANICEHTSSIIEISCDELEIELEQMEFEF